MIPNGGPKINSPWVNQNVWEIILIHPWRLELGFGKQFTITTATVHLLYRQFAFRIAIAGSARLPALF